MEKEQEIKQQLKKIDQILLREQNQGYIMFQETKKKLFLYMEKEILQQEGRDLTIEEAAREWIDRYAGDFPSLSQ